jgi:predicted ribosome quality control (RQC) complex YloA/Tae2 family protein
MRFRLFDWLLKDYDFDPNYRIKINDEEGNEYCLVSLCAQLAREVKKLENRITTLEQKYEGALIDIKRLEEENVETTNYLYENANSINAVDSRIDILVDHYRNEKGT